MPTKRKKAAPPSSAATYTERRDERIAHYYFVRRVTRPPAIYDYLVLECRECLAPDIGSSHADPNGVPHKFAPLISTNRASGLKTVQTAVMKLRAAAKPEEILALRRPVETEKVRKTWEYLLTKQIEVIEDQSFVNVEKVAPSGDVVTIKEPRCTKQEKGRAVKAAMLLAEKIGKISGARFEPTDAEEGAGDGAGATGQQPPADAYTFAFPNVTGQPSDLDVMIAMNLDRGKVN